MTAKIATLQAPATREPDLLECDMALAIRCGCGTLRVFKITEALGLIAKREWAGTLIEVTCGKCGKNIGVAIGWIKADSGFTYRVPPFITDCINSKVAVLDESPMREPKTEKP